MARHAEVTEQEIIDAGVAIEQLGKRPNSGAIRVKLGNRGGFPRIKEVWDNHLSTRESKGVNDNDDTVIELPAEIQENLELNTKKAIKNLENITKNSYKVAQQIAEKRVSSTIDEYIEKIDYFKESEQQAGIALEACDNQISDLNDELENLKNNNETMLSENSHLSGQLSSANDQINSLQLKEKELFELKEKYGKLQGMYEVLSSR